MTLATETPGGATEPRGDLGRLQLYLAMCAGPDSDVSGGKGARAVDGITQSAIPALAGNPPGSQNPSQRHRRPTADNDARVSRRPSHQASERSVLVDAGSSIRANAAASPPGRARSSPISTLPRRQSQTHDGLELEGIRRRASNEAAARCEGSDEDSLTCRCPLDTPHKRRRAPSSSDTDDDATDDDDDVRSPLKRRAAAEALAACPPAPPLGTPRLVRECSMDFASLLSILDDDGDAGALSRQNSSRSFADETTWIDLDVDHLMCDVVSDCLATRSSKIPPRIDRLRSASPHRASLPPPAPPPSLTSLTSSRGLSATAAPFAPSRPRAERRPPTRQKAIGGPTFRTAWPPVRSDRRSMWAGADGSLPSAGEVLRVLEGWRLVQHSVGVPC